MALVVLTGPARSGKSRHAEALASELQRRGELVTVAAFGRPEGDPEFEERIRRHQARRPVGFETLEIADPLRWTPQDEEGTVLVIECAGTLLSAIMSDLWEAMHDAGAEEYERDVDVALSRVVEALIRRSADTIVVTNETGWGIVPEHASGRVFRDVLGRANRRLIAQADAAYLCVAGRVLDLSRLPQEASWPED